MLAVSFFIASMRDPGYLRPSLPFLELLKKVHPVELCPECEVIRSHRSKHCGTCNRCVERFDHHCPWVNNCVGVNNHNPYLVFIVSLLLVLIMIIISSIVMLANDCRPDDSSIDVKEACPLIEFCFGCRNLAFRYIMLFITLCVSLFFGGPASILVYIHTKNFLAGKTTNERFAKNARTSSSSSLASNNSITSTAESGKRTGYENCAAFCCVREIPEQESLVSRYVMMHPNVGSGVTTNSAISTP